MYIKTFPPHPALPIPDVLGFWQSGQFRKYRSETKSLQIRSEEDEEGLTVIREVMTFDSDSDIDEDF